MKRKDLVVGEDYAVVRHGRYRGWENSTSSISRMRCLAVEPMVRSVRSAQGTTVVNGLTWEGLWVPPTKWQGPQFDACMAYLRDYSRPGGPFPQELGRGIISVTTVPLGQIIGPWEKVYAEHLQREREVTASAERARRASLALRERGNAAEERARALGLTTILISPPGSVSMSLTVFEDILERLTTTEGEQ